VLTPQEEQYVQELLRTSNSIRDVARRSGFARGTVQRIAQGVHTKRRAKSQSQLLPEGLGPGVRCGSCGALLVEVPCVACRTRGFSNALPRIAELLGAPLGLGLHGKQRLRYEALHAHKVAAGPEAGPPSRRRRAG
jgi:hypothetical protein